MSTIDQNEYYADDDAYAENPENHLIARALVPKFAAGLSLFGSSMILTELYLDWRLGNARDGATSRILASMSVADFIFATGYFLTTWPAPSDLTYILFNVGNQATCTFQGFLFQLGYVASPLFNVTLALFFLLRIRYRWTDFRLRRLEPWIQGSIWIFALACAIYPIPLGLYNNAWEVCWIESYPMDCRDSYRYGDAANCTRGDNAWIHALVFQVFPPWVCVFCALIFMGLIYATVRKVEQRNTRYAGSHYASSAEVSTSYMSKSRFSSIMATLSRSAVPPHASTTPKHTSAVVVEANNTRSSQQPGGGRGETIITPNSETDNTPQQPCQSRRIKKTNRQRSDKVATQAMWYIAAFFATYILDFIAAVCWYAADLWWFWLDIFAYFFLPLQGFFNFCVFIRTRKMKSRIGRLARKVLCCLEGKVSISQIVLYFFHSCCDDDDNTTTMSRGGGGDKNSAITQCPTLPPPSCNKKITGCDAKRKSTKVTFASPPTSERSASPSSCCPTPNPCSNNIIITDHSSAQTSPSTNSWALLEDDQESKNEVE